MRSPNASIGTLRRECLDHLIVPLEVPGEVDSPEALARAPAAALFLERARAVGAALAPDGATATTVAQICRRLDGLPLAIELAAAWTRLLPPPALLARLERRLPLLVGGPHDLPARQRTMREAIAWSYDLLDAGQQRLFRWLAVFAGGSTPEAAETVCGAAGAGGDVLHGLAALVDSSLLRVQDDARAGAGEGRLTMLETLREYGLERLAECGEGDAAGDRHATYYLAVAEAAEPELSGPDGSAWLARLEQEHANLRAALGWLLGRGAGEGARGGGAAGDRAGGVQRGGGLL
jgi:predicted ATPase